MQITESWAMKLHSLVETLPHFHFLNEDQQDLLPLLIYSNNLSSNSFEQSNHSSSEGR